MRKRKTEEPVYVSDPNTITRDLESKLKTAVYEIAKLREENEVLRQKLKELEEPKTNAKAANKMKDIYDAYMLAGFTDEQAFSLLVKLFEASVGGK